MNIKENDEWWTSLHINEKERIASKIADRWVSYPECTDVWISLDESKRTWIRNHCTDKHGYVSPEWQEGFMFSE